MHTKKLYIVVTTALVLGYSWLFLSGTALQNTGFTPCFFRNCTGFACPSCGTTRSVSHIFKGDITKGILINPLGFIVAVLMIILPVWLLYDITLKKNSFFSGYKKAERIITLKPVAIVLITLITVNWIWNIYKGL